MILDSSALVSVILREPGHEAVLGRMTGSRSDPEPLGIGAATLVEVMLVLSNRLHGDPTAELTELLRALEVEVLPFTEEHSLVAIRAYARYGKGRHKAALNYGDCMAYAIAKVAGQPLLFVGADFRYTDVQAAIA
ncbi:MAG: type II toxin-antitoxin system VapC family toxin [Bryobacteraceae bacterium]